MGDKLVKIVGFLGAAANWTIPVASLASLQNDPSRIDPFMTTTLAFYSFAFMRWSVAIIPANYLLTACHITNASAQLIQLGRWAANRSTSKPQISS